MRFDHVTYSLNSSPIPSPVAIVAPQLVGTTVTARSKFLFLYQSLANAQLLTFLSLSSAILTCQWPDTHTCSIPVSLAVSGPVATYSTLVPQAPLGIGPLAEVMLATNTYVGDPFPSTPTTTLTYTLPANLAIVVTCTVTADTMIVTPQFQAIAY